MKNSNTNITTVQICDLKPFANNPRTHTKKQISQIARSLEQFGWTNPVLIDEDGMILAGHGRVTDHVAGRSSLDAEHAQYGSRWFHCWHGTSFNSSGLHDIFPSPG